MKQNIYMQDMVPLSFLQKHFFKITVILHIQCFCMVKKYYDKDIGVKTIDHVSTGKMKSKFYYECNYKSLVYLIDKFYRKGL